MWFCLYDRPICDGFHVHTHTNTHTHTPRAHAALYWPLSVRPLDQTSCRHGSELRSAASYSRHSHATSSGRLPVTGRDNTTVRDDDHGSRASNDDYRSAWKRFSDEEVIREAVHHIAWRKYQEWALGCSCQRSHSMEKVRGVTFRMFMSEIKEEAYRKMFVSNYDAYNYF